MSDTTIRRKLSVIVFLSIAVTVLGITGASVWREADRYAHSLSVELKATAGVFATAVSEATANGDRSGTLRVLKAIGRVPRLSYARVEDSWGRTIGEIGSSVRLVGGKSQKGVVNRVDLLRGEPVEIAVPVIKGGAQVGSLMLVTYPVDLWPRIWTGIRDTLIWALFVGALALLASTRLSRGISNPIRALAETMSQVRSEQDFSRTMSKGSIRELSVLIESFNDMMGNIRERDERLARHRERLEDDVAERTRDLMVAKDEAVAANAAKSDFLATMSHEIRTPMNGMLVMAELLTKAELSENLRRYAEVISSSGRSLMTIINDILDLSKIEAGKLDLEKTDMRLTQMLRDVLLLFQERAAEKGLDLTGFVAADVKDAILSDPVRLRQVVGNLVSNAIKFTESGHVAVTFQVLDPAEAATAQTLRITIEDTGIGIPEDKVATVFEAFSQADQSTTRKFGGTGLGLAICRNLAESFNGRIYAESILGQGSRFIVELSVEIATEQPVCQIPDEVLLARAILAISGARSRTALADTLSVLGIETVVEIEGYDGEPAPGDLILADLDAIGAMKKSPFAERLDGPYYIAVSTFGAEGADEACVRGDADALVYRPALAPDLVDALVMLTPQGRKALQADRKTGKGVAETLRWPEANVLVADDSPVNQEVAREALARFGIVPDIVENGAEAVRAAADKTYDLILMDCSMPVMDGYEASRHIRDAETARVPIIALTAQVMDEAKFDWQSAGMDALLAKPFTLDQLKACLVDNLKAGTGEPTSQPDAAFENEAVVRVAPVLHAQSPTLSAEAETVPTGSRPAILRTGHLDALAGGAGGDGSALVERILSLFEKHAPGAVDQLKSVAGGEDPAALAEAAHALKSMSANIGAERLASLCGDMEKAAKHGTFPENLDTLDTVYRETLEAVVLFKTMTAPGAGSLSGLGLGF